MNLPNRERPAPKLPLASAHDAGERRRERDSLEDRLIEGLRLQERLACEEFARDYAVGPYTLRWYCPAARLSVEIEEREPSSLPAPGAPLERIDAGALRRAARDAFLQSVGIEVLRISERDLRDSSEGGDKLETLVMRIARQIERRMRVQRERQRRRSLVATPPLGDPIRAPAHLP